MTEEELDLIASAYADGEATPEEVAMVERDPALAARVEEFRALDTQVSAVSMASPDLREQHLAAALAAFETAPHVTGTAPATVSVDGPETVIDLTRRSATRAEPADHPAGEPPQVFPRWLAAAAAVVVIGGGVVFAANRLGPGGDDADTADGAFEAVDEAVADDTTGGSDDEEGAGTAIVEQDGRETFATEEVEEVEEGDAVEDQAMEDEEAMEDEAPADDEVDADGGSGESTTGDASASAPTSATAEARDGDAETTEGGLFPDEPVMSFNSVPDPGRAIATMPERRTDVLRSRCGEALTVPASSEVVAFLPIEIAGSPAELFVVADGNGSESGLIVDGDCGELTP